MPDEAQEARVPAIVHHADFLHLTPDWAIPPHRTLLYALEQRLEVCRVCHLNDDDLATPQVERDEIRARPALVEITIECDVVLRREKDVSVEREEGRNIMFMLGHFFARSFDYAVSPARKSNRFQQ